MNVVADQVAFDVDFITNPTALQISVLQGERDDRDGKSVAPAFVYGETDTVDRHRPFGHQQRPQTCRDAKSEHRKLTMFAYRCHRADAVHMAGDEMTTEPLLQTHRLFQIDQAAQGKFLEVGSRQSF